MIVTSAVRTTRWYLAVGLVAPLLAAVAVTVFPPATSAQEALPIPLRLSWDAPAGCPVQSTIVSEVSELLRGGASDARAAVVATVSVRKGAAGTWDVRMVTTRQGETGERTFQADTCESAGRAASLILAIAIDPKQAAAARLAASESAAPLAPVAEPMPSRSAPAVVSSAMPAIAPHAVPPSAPAAVPSRMPPQAQARPWAVGMAAETDVGSLPAPALGIRLHSLRWLGSSWVEVYGAAWPGARGSDPSRPDVGGKLELFVGGAGVGYSFTSGPLRVGPIVGLEAGAMRGTGFGVSNPTSVWGPWSAATAGVRLSSPIVGPVGVGVASGAVVPLWRDEFVLEGIGAIHRPSAVSWRTVFGLDLVF